MYKNICNYICAHRLFNMLIVDLQYFPPISFFSTLFKYLHVEIDIYEPYRKMTFRNRCIIAGAEGIVGLSVPLELGRNQRKPLTEVMISNTENWQTAHWKAMKSCYNRSPFFEFYRDELEGIYGGSFAKLADWNLRCLGWVIKKLIWEGEWKITDSPVAFESRGADDLRDRVLPKNYMQWDPVQYRQVFHERTGFLPNLSILDLLFNTGPQAGDLLRASLDFQDS